MTTWSKSHAYKLAAHLKPGDQVRWGLSRIAVVQEVKECFGGFIELKVTCGKECETVHLEDGSKVQLPYSGIVIL